MSAQASLPGDLLAVPTMTARLLDTARQAEPRTIEDWRGLLRAAGCTDPVGVFEQLRSAGFFTTGHPRPALTTLGYRTLLFVSGALGQQSDRVFDELRPLEPTLQRYELVREGMTTRFIKGLLAEPGFQRIYIASPWINLQKSDLARLATALGNARRSLAREPEVLILVQTPKPDMKAGLKSLADLGATIVEKRTLHSKLYMREPGPSGGLALAIVGSENLTRPKWIELGIQVRNDSHILGRLRSYFFDIYGRAGGE